MQAPRPRSAERVVLNHADPAWHYASVRQPREGAHSSGLTSSHRHLAAKQALVVGKSRLLVAFAHGLVRTDWCTVRIAHIT